MGRFYKWDLNEGSTKNTFIAQINDEPFSLDKFNWSFLSRNLIQVEIKKYFHHRLQSPPRDYIFLPGVKFCLRCSKFEIGGLIILIFNYNN